MTGSVGASLPIESAAKGESVAACDALLGPEQAVVKKLFMALEDVNLDLAMSTLAEGILFENPLIPTRRGKKKTRQMLSFLAALADELSVVSYDNIVGQGENVAFERVECFKCYGLRFKLPIVGMFRVIDGEIVEWRDYFDWVTLMLNVVKSLLLLPIRLLRYLFARW